MTTEIKQDSLKLFTDLANVIVNLEKAKSNKSILMTFNETTHYLSLTDSMLRKLVFNRSIPFLKVGKSLRFNKDEINNWLELECKV